MLFHVPFTPRKINIKNQRTYWQITFQKGLQKIKILLKMYEIWIDFSKYTKLINGFDIVLDAIKWSSCVHFTFSSFAEMRKEKEERKEIWLNH